MWLEAEAAAVFRGRWNPVLLLSAVWVGMFSRPLELEGGSEVLLVFYLEKATLSFSLPGIHDIFPYCP